MTRFKYFASFLIAALGISTSSAFALSEAELRFSYDPTDGYMYLTVELDRASPRNCTLKVRGAVSHEGDLSLASDTLLYRGRFDRKQLLDFELSNMPGVTNETDGSRPILNLQARIQCPGRRRVDIRSNAFARYVNCGATVRDVAPRAFLRTLKSRLSGQDGDLSED